MTRKEQKAGAHIARANELLRQNKLSFGTNVPWSNLPQSAWETILGNFSGPDLMDVKKVSRSFNNAAKETTKRADEMLENAIKYPSSEVRHDRKRHTEQVYQLVQKHQPFHPARPDDNLLTLRTEGGEPIGLVRIAKFEINDNGELVFYGWGIGYPHPNDGNHIWQGGKLITKCFKLVVGGIYKITHVRDKTYTIEGMNPEDMNFEFEPPRRDNERDQKYYNDWRGIRTGEFKMKTDEEELIELQGDRRIKTLILGITASDDSRQGN